MNRKAPLTLGQLAAIAGLAMLAACAQPPPPQVAVAPPPPPPPPPPQLAPIPPRPLPPGGAQADMHVPTIGADGLRRTVNVHLTPLQVVWNLRAGWNVAALNCLAPRYKPILDGYKAFLKDNAKHLSSVNRQLDREYRKDFGLRATKMREEFMTQVYNYFALPPARSYFCGAALEMSEQALASPPGDIDAFAQAELPKLEGAFDQFYDDFDRYKVDVAAWDARYGKLYGQQGNGMVYTSAVTSGDFEGDAGVPLTADDSSPSAAAQGAARPNP